MCAMGPMIGWIALIFRDGTVTRYGRLGRPLTSYSQLLVTVPASQPVLIMASSRLNTMLYHYPSPELISKNRFKNLIKTKFINKYEESVTCDNVMYIESNRDK